VTWSDYRNGELDVLLATSDDGGKHWSAPMRVNDDPIHDGADHFFQWLAVAPTDGSIDVIFYDRRRDPLNRKQIVVLARSTDSGHSFNNYAWTDEAFEVGSVFFGDYSGIAAYGGRVYGVWTEEPAPAPEVKPKPEEGKEAKESKEAKPQPRGTIVKVGTADFATPDHSK
ncbi:MAG: sialidase family protein, partial [Candidatus Sulfotelmatobacter sp.]